MAVLRMKTIVKIGFAGLLSAVLMTSASAEMTKMQKAKHASPMPSLMMLIQMNASELGLDDEQLEIVQDWKRENHHHVNHLIKEIIDTEKELHQITLEGADEDEKDELRDIILEARGELIDTKHRCVTKMKKTLDKEQWAQLMKMREQQARVAASGQKAGNEIQAFLRVSPMPKLMAIVLMHNKELNLSGEQKKALENWRLKNMNHWAMLFDQVLTTEKQITQDALGMKDAKLLMAEFDRMADKRREMAQMSLACRDNMKKVLNAEQWETLLTLFKRYM